MNNKKEVKKFLWDQMQIRLTELIQRYIINLSGDDEVKETLEVNEIINNLLTGKPWPEKDRPFLEKNKDLWEEIYSYSKDIKFINSLDDADNKF